MILLVLFIFILIAWTIAAVGFVIIQPEDDYTALAICGAAFSWPVSLPIFMVACVVIFVNRLNDELSK